MPQQGDDSDESSRRWTAADDGAPAAAPEIPGYRVERELRRGGQGVVFEASQLATGRRVALKVVPWLDASERARRRFEREIELASSLSHPALVTIFDGGEAPGVRWLAMELVAGVELGEWMRQAGHDVPERLRVFVRACLGMEHAHARGVLHRDLKPANILVMPDGQPRILDFGLARPLGEDHAASLTATGVFAGTLTHASPEQVRGDSRAMDTRTDVYALGVVLHELLTGQLPIEPADDLHESLRRILHDEPAPPSSRVKGLGRDLDTICLRALAKDPARRYASVESLRRDVECFLAERPIEARRDSTLYVAAKTARRHRLALLAAAIVVAGLVAALVGVTAERNRAQDAVAGQQRVNTFLVELLSGAYTAKGPKSLQELADWGEAEIPRRFADDEILAAQLKTSFARVRIQLGDKQNVARGIDLAREAVVALRPQGDTPELADAVNMLGAGVRRRSGAARHARAFFEEALAVAEGAEPPRVEQVVAFKQNLAMALKRDAPDRALRLMNEALPDAMTALGPTHETTRRLRRNLAALVAGAGDAAGGERLVRELLEDEWEQGLMDSSHASTLSALNEIVGKDKTRQRELLATASEAFATLLAVQGPVHPSTGEAAANFAMYLQWNEQPASACALLLHADAICAGSVDPAGDLCEAVRRRIAFGKCRDAEAAGSGPGS